MMNYNTEAYELRHRVTAFRRYLSELMITRANFGKTVKSSGSTKDDLMVCGHIIYHYGSGGSHGEEPAPIYKTIDKAVVAYENIFDKDSLSEILKYLKVNSELTDEAEQMIKDLDAMQVLPVPFKPKSQIYVVGKDENNKQISDDCTISSIKWMAEENNGDIYLKCMVICKKNGKADKLYKVNIEELGKSLMPKGYLGWEIKDKAYSELISATRLGLLRTIQFNSGDESIIVDNMYIYHKKNGIVHVVGELGSDLEPIRFNESLEKVLKGTKLLKKVTSNLDMLKAISRLVIPYGLGEINIINVDAKKK